VTKDEVAAQVAQQAFNCMGYMPTPERLDFSILGVAWKLGFPKPKRSQFDLLRNYRIARNPWEGVSIHYHYQEALIVRFWSMQAEVKFGYLSKIMRMTEADLAIPVRASGIVPLDVLRAMTQWSLARAGQRARAVSSPGTISLEDATKIFNSLVLSYEALVSASVQDTRPIPIKDFQLGLSRDHPWTEFLCVCADNLCKDLDLDDAVRPLASVTMELAVSQVQNGLYTSLQSLP